MAWIFKGFSYWCRGFSDYFIAWGSKLIKHKKLHSLVTLYTSQMPAGKRKRLLRSYTTLSTRSFSWGQCQTDTAAGSRYPLQQRWTTWHHPQCNEASHYKLELEPPQTSHRDRKPSISSSVYCGVSTVQHIPCEIKSQWMLNPVKGTTFVIFSKRYWMIKSSIASLHFYYISIFL